MDELAKGENSLELSADELDFLKQSKLKTVELRMEKPEVDEGELKEGILRLVKELETGKEFASTCENLYNFMMYLSHYSKQTPFKSALMVKKEAFHWLKAIMNNPYVVYHPYILTCILIHFQINHEVCEAIQCHKYPRIDQILKFLLRTAGYHTPGGDSNSKIPMPT